MVEQPDVDVVMNHVGGEDDDVRWFEFRTGYYDAPVRVEWEKGTMACRLPADVAAMLFSRGYATPALPRSDPPPAEIEPAPAPIAVPKKTKRAPEPED